MPETDRDKQNFYRGMLLGGGIGLVVGLLVTVFVQHNFLKQ